MTSSDEQFLQSLRAAFAQEAAEHIQEMSQCLLDMEALAPGVSMAGLLEKLFREIHSLKGAARAVAAGGMESVCQALENLLVQWRGGDFVPSPGSFDVLHGAATALGLHLKCLDDPGATPPPAAPLVSQIRALGQKNGAKVQPAAIPESPFQDPVATVPGAPRTAPEVQVQTTPLLEVAPEPIPETQVAPPEIRLEVTPAPEPPGGEAEHPPPSAHGERTDEPHKDAPQVTGETVRIATERLDGLLLQAEELLVLKIAAANRTVELTQVMESVRHWQQEWTKLVALLESASGPEQGQRPSHQQMNGLHSQWQVLEENLANLVRAAEQEGRTTGGLVDNLLHDTKKLLMQPFSNLTRTLPLVVRDLARSQAKDVKFEIHGQGVQIDKRILEEMKDPLIHLLRNAVDHGVESPQQRLMGLKPPQARLILTITQKGASEVEVVLSDDGAGINTQALLRNAQKKGLLTAEEAESFTREAAMDLIFASSLSTSPIITEISGRGLGMAIVREKVEKLGGAIEVHSQPGRGTSFHILLPLTQATFQGVLVEAGGQQFVLPVVGVDRVIRLSPDVVRTVANRETIVLQGETGGEVLPLADLGSVLGQPASSRSASRTWQQAVILKEGEARVAFRVDQVLHDQEVLVKPLTRPLVRLRHISGTTILGTGRVVPILQVGDLLQSAAHQSVSPAAGNSLASAEENVPRSVLIAEDSLTSRMLLKNILESAGYLVRTAVDGQEAVKLLEETSFDLVVSDVDMPHVNGFQLTEKIRAHAEWGLLPVVLVTARNTPEDRERGVDAGANAYIVKSSFDQNDLVEVVQRLIG